MSKIGDIVERLPSRIVQVVRWGITAPRVVLCADGSAWERDGGWRCTEPPHEAEPSTDWKARAIEAGAALARVTAERDAIRESWEKVGSALTRVTAERDEARAEREQLKTIRRVIAEEMGEAHAEAEAQRERAATAEAARQLAEHRCTELERARVEAVARQIQAVADGDAGKSAGSLCAHRIEKRGAR